MTAPPTVHRLLWGPNREGRLGDWRVRPWETPAVGLPVRVAVAFFSSARHQSGYPDGWRPGDGPLTWEIFDGCDVLAAGRQLQFGFRSGLIEDNGVQRSTTIETARRSIRWEIDPHPAYFLPFAAAHPDDVNQDSYALYCDILLLLTAIDGGEAILSTLSETGVGAVPFEDRWSWRSRVHLPKEAWRQVERAFRWIEGPASDASQIEARIREALEPWTPVMLTIQSFTHERVDLLLPSEGDAEKDLEVLDDDLEIVRTVQASDSRDSEIPENLLLDDAKLNDKLRVRLGQIDRWARRDRVVEHFPHIDAVSTERIMEQVAAAFQSPGYGHSDRDPELVLLPEVTVPNLEVATVRDLVRITGRASLAGLYWRVLPPVYGGRCDPTSKWFVNEAELVLPVGFRDRGPTGIRWYRVRKPRPAHMEDGLARALNAQQGIYWNILPGQRWYRFVHRRWGDFTIAICSDLLDAAPWRSLRGELLHLFMVAFNRDVGFFESLTWVRAYEDYVNLVSVNHGAEGGSFVWTPRRRHERELARVRGRSLFVTADVNIPIKSMMAAQKNGGDDAVVRAMREWLNLKSPPPEFKAPPPGYKRRVARV